MTHFIYEIYINARKIYFINELTTHNSRNHIIISLREKKIDQLVER